jgi:hypothetical protein
MLVPLSAVDCVQPALQHTRQQLFKPFRWGQWSRLALVGILASELHLGGCNFGGFNFPGLHPKTPGTGHEFLPSSKLPAALGRLSSSYISAHIAQFLGLILLAVFVFVILAFVFLYINSVFRFILFDAVLRRQCSISEGWRKWHRAGGRFFLWQIVFQVFVSLAMGILIGLPLAGALAAGWMTDPKAHIVPLIIGGVLLFGTFCIFLLASIATQVLARDFLVPIMALEGLDFADGWHRLLEMIGPEKGRFAGYLLLKLVLAIAAGIIFTILAIIPALLITVPSVVAVVAGRAAGLGWSVTTISLAIICGTMLLFLMFYLIALVCVPATVFFPAYALHFLASRYPALDALLHPAPPPAPELPPMPEVPPPFETPPLPPSPEPIG